MSPASHESGNRLNPRNGTDTIDSGVRFSGTGGVLVKPRRGCPSAERLHPNHIRDEDAAVRLVLYTVFDPDGTIILTGEPRDIDYVIPARYALGVSWRAPRNWTLLFDVSRVRYSERVTDKFLVVDFVDPAAGLTPSNFYINDAVPKHMPVSSTSSIQRRARWLVRGGVFTDRIVHCASAAAATIPSTPPTRS